MSLSALPLLLPASDTTWQVWKARSREPGAFLASPTEASARVGKGCVIGLPVTACRTVGLVLPNADHEVLEQILMTQLDRRGIKLQAGDERNFRWHLLSQTATTATVSVDALVDPFPEELSVQEAADYTAALRLTEMPQGQIILTEEQGNWVLAAGFHGKLYHSHLVAPAGALPPDELASEVDLARMTLEADLGEGLFTGAVMVGTGWDQQYVKALQDITGLQVRTSSQLRPQKDIESQVWPRMLPASVREAQRSAASRSRWARAMALGVLLLLSLAFLAFAYLRFQETQAAQLQADVDATTEPASLVRQTAEKWKSLAPAIESKRYPLVLLNEITKLMPPSGLVIRRFTLKDNEIDLQGEARDAQTAVQFMEDLQKNSLLSRYTWSKPSPSVKGSVAQFRTQGKASP